MLQFFYNLSAGGAVGKGQVFFGGNQYNHSGTGFGIRCFICWPVQKIGSGLIAEIYTTVIADTAVESVKNIFGIALVLREIF